MCDRDIVTGDKGAGRGGRITGGTDGRTGGVVKGDVGVACDRGRG